ncbi:MAG: M23 family metallopeptidase, partial [bacterium]
NGLHSMYIHLSDILVEEGEQVSKGQILGESGSTGRVTGPHLHLGIQVDGARIDPDRLFQSNLGPK